MNHLNFRIEPLKKNRQHIYQNIIGQKTKPPGSLGALETIALQMATIQQAEKIIINRPTVIIYASDYGIASEGVSAYPAEVTAQMVLNFLAGGAAINTFCRLNQLDLLIVDAGVDHDFEDVSGLIDRKIRKSTTSFLHEPAMTEEECRRAIEAGAELVADQKKNGSNIIGFGEMGIANTSSASCIMHCITGISREKCVGRGTGLDDEQLEKKINILKLAINNHGPMRATEPLKILQTFGGFELAMMAGSFLKAAEQKMIILVDGFIATAAFMVAARISEEVKDYAIFCHRSDEQGHKLMLDYLEATEILNLGLRLGEATGVAIAFPLIRAAAAFYNEMASFTEARVSEKH